MPTPKHDEEKRKTKGKKKISEEDKQTLADFIARSCSRAQYHLVPAYQLH